MEREKRRRVMVTRKSHERVRNGTRRRRAQKGMSLSRYKSMPVHGQRCWRTNDRRNVGLRWVGGYSDTTRGE